MEKSAGDRADVLRYANIGENCGSMKYGTIRMASFYPNIIFLKIKTPAAEYSYYPAAGVKYMLCFLS